MKKWLKYSWVIVFFAYLLINIIFNRHFLWSELFFDRSKVGAVEGEIYASEWGLEQIYQKIINFNNPFSPIKSMLYPFGIDSAMTDGGLSLYFIFLRPFLSTHQTLMIAIALNLLIANIAMYALLRKMDFDIILSFLIGLCFGFMTFLSPRMGAHPSYTVTGLFPLFYLAIITFLKSKTKRVKLISSIFAAIFFVIMFWQNMYYFIILLISIGCLIIYFFWKEKTFVLNLIIKNLLYIFFTVIIIILLLTPCLIEFYKILLFSGAPRSMGWGGAIELSADLFGIFVPSIYNRYYGWLILQIGTNWKFGGQFEHFIYSGIVILIVYICLAFFYKKISKKIKKEIMPYLLTSLVFLILSFGPFLHVLGTWWIQVEEEIKIFLPLPFVVLHYIPFLGNIRAPGRLIVGFIFFAYIVSAYLITYFLKDKSKFFKTIFFLLLFIVFFVDHRYDDRLAAPGPSFYPNKLFNIVKKDKDKVTVLEIPFTVRDGFTYFGDCDAILSVVGQISYQKPFLGGYSGRIPDYIKQYYQNNPFFGYLGRNIDLSQILNPMIDQQDLINWTIPQTKQDRDVVDFLDLKYIILNENKPYKQKITSFLNEVGYKKITNEKNYSLFVRQPEKKEFLDINVSATESATFLGMGWYLPENDFRWADRRSSAMFKIQKARNLILNFQAEAFYRNQPVTIYLNQKKIARITVSPTMKYYKVPVNKVFEKGINTISFIFDKGLSPYNIDPLNLDTRRLSAKFTKIFLTETNNR